MKELLEKLKSGFLSNRKFYKAKADEMNFHIRPRLCDDLANFRKTMNTENNLNIFADYPDVVTVKDLQQMLHIGRDTAYSLLEDKSIIGRKIGRGYIIPKNNVIRFVEAIA